MKNREPIPPTESDAFAGDQLDQLEKNLERFGDYDKITLYVGELRAILNRFKELDRKIDMNYRIVRGESLMPPY